MSHQGSDALPAYFLRHPDPSLPGSKNRYAVALYDSYNPEILFGEVLLIPDWTQPNLNKEELRLNGGVLPPPQPVLPTEFVIQLYNPDQQVHVKWINGSWNTSSHFYFEIPEKSFRQPSVSSLDRTQSDPTASENTPKLGFKWKKDGKFSKDYVCSLSGKSTNPDGSKRKNREPDITISLFKHFKEITIYEPNLSRVEIEDPKGLEVVLLLGAIVIREVYNSGMHEAFNITDSPNTVPLVSTANSGGQSHGRRRHSSHSNQPPQQPPRHSSSDPRPPPTDPRTQWELDVEAARLKKQVEAEERDRRRAEAAETKRVKKMLEDEDRRRREKEMEINRETERLKKLYGKQQRQSLQQPPKPQQQSKPSHGPPVTAYPPAPVQRPHSAAPSPYLAHNLRPSGPQQQASYPQQQNPYLNPSAGGAANASTFFSSSGAPQQQLPKKSSFWHLGRKDDSASRLTKQRSTVF